MVSYYLETQLDFYFCLKFREFQKHIDSTIKIRTNHVVYKTIIFKLLKSWGSKVTPKIEIQTVQNLYERKEYKFSLFVKQKKEVITITLRIK